MACIHSKHCILLFYSILVKLKLICFLPLNKFYKKKDLICYQMESGEHGLHGALAQKAVVEALKIGPESVTALRQTLVEQLVLVQLRKIKAVQPRPALLVGTNYIILFNFKYHQNYGMKECMNCHKLPWRRTNIVCFLSAHH